MINRAYISINNACNLNCRYCSFRAIDTINNDEPFANEDLEIILKNIVDYAAKNEMEKFVIGICGAGEPLLNYNNIRFMIEWAEENNKASLLHFYTITNGTFINDEMINFFHNHKGLIDLNFSLDGYEDLHNLGKAKFKNVIEGLNKYKSTFGEYPIIQCTVTRDTIENKEKVVDFFVKEGFLKINFGFLFNITDKDLIITYTEYQDFLKYIAENTPIVARQNKKRKKYDCRIYGNYCSVGRNNPFITKQGVYPCCRFHRNEDYKFADFYTPFQTMENAITENFIPVAERDCYFNTHIKRKNKP